ncbi:MAG: hypothetical protein HZB76_07220 [Chlamydiae bacterium]|nr:hypothetical protein [Chlamydiota bacterium]
MPKKNSEQLFYFFRVALIITLFFLMGTKTYCDEKTEIKAKESSLCGLFFETYGGIFWGFTEISNLTTKTTYNIQKLKASFENSSANKFFSLTGIGGVKLGTWLEKAKYFDHPSPSWLKHFGFYADLNYHYLKYDHALKNTKIRYLDFSVDPSLGPAFATTTIRLKTQGPSALASFMFAGRLGFFKTKDVPLGWFQPYMAIGPGAFFVKQKAKLVVSPHETDNQSQFYLKVATPQTMETVHFDKKIFPALALDFGFDFRPYKHLSFDYFFKYCYVVPHFSYSAFLWEQKETCHLFSNQLGIALHF